MRKNQNSDICEALECDVAVVGAGPAGCAAARACTANGLRVILVEKKRIPRHKACSGILVPDSVNLLLKHFGDLPLHVLAVPPDVSAMRMHFPDGRTADIPISGRMIRRDHLDAWLSETSGADVMDETKMLSCVENPDEVLLFCTRPDGDLITIHSKVAIAADGGSSKTVTQIEPTRQTKLPWYVALQDTYACKGRLEQGYFHFFAFPEISLYPSAYMKDDLLMMEVVVRLGERAKAAMAGFKDFLWKRTGIEYASLIRQLGCRVTYAAPRGIFCFGTERILVCGEASGLLNLFGEGISSALASGIIAGKAAVSGIRKDVPPGRFYQHEIQKEKRKTLGTFNYKTLLFREGSAFNFKKGLNRLKWKERLTFYKNLIQWMLTLRKQDN